MTNIEVRGMQLFRNDDGRKPYKTLALAEIIIPELTMTISEVRLTWSKERGFIAMAPFVRGKRQQINWKHKSMFGRDAAAALKTMYRRMGGTLPTDEPEFVPLHEIDLAGIPEDMPHPLRVKRGLDRIHETTGRNVYTTMLGLSTDDVVAAAEAQKADDAEPEADDAEVMAGLHRALGVIEESVAEAERAVG